MRRMNIKDAFVGEPTPNQEGVHADDSDEALVLRVRGGEVVLVVPAGTSEEGAVAQAEIVRGALRLENERVLTFEIREGASGAFFDDESADLHRDRQRAGSSGLSNIEGHDYMGERHTAGELMSRDVVTVSPDMLVEDVAKLLAFHNISGMPVEDNSGHIVGVVSEVDVIGKIGTVVADVMTPDVVSVEESMPIKEIATLMFERRIKRVPVLANGALCGIVTRADIVRALAGPS
jgi:CBS domain-containing protein